MSKKSTKSSLALNSLNECDVKAFLSSANQADRLFLNPYDEVVDYILVDPTERRSLTSVTFKFTN
jgi:hypothetical protein